MLWQDLTALFLYHEPYEHKRTTDYYVQPCSACGYSPSPGRTREYGAPQRSISVCYDQEQRSPLSPTELDSFNQARLWNSEWHPLKGTLLQEWLDRRVELQSDTSDYADFLLQVRCIVFTTAILCWHFASVLPGIAFSLDLIETTQQYGVAEVLLSSFMAAFIFSVFGAQPLCIAGVTGNSPFVMHVFQVLKRFQVRSQY